MMRKCFLTMLLLSMVVVVGAQDKKFSPEKFEAEMESYITREAGLTQQEAAVVFPLMREMHKKQRGYYVRMHKMAKNKPDDEVGCEAMVNEYDKLNIEMKQIEKCYHKKMMQQVAASKVYEIIKAEYRFHRSWMKGVNKKDRQR